MKLSLLVVFAICLYSHGQSVYYGEKKPNSVPSLYFDKDGILYPDKFISNQEMDLADGRLLNYYASNPNVFSALCSQFQIVNKGLTESIAEVNKALFKKTLSSFKKDEKELIFIIHGFRKSFVEQNNDNTSNENFDTIINSYPKEKEGKFVKVFWDAYYDCCISGNFIKNKEIFYLFEQARINASKVGLTLGSLLNQSELSNYTLLSFSLGAKVVSTALASLTLKPYPIECILVAPAICGEDLKAPLEKVERRNKINLSIIYNENDFVLKKKDPKTGLFGPGVLKYGNTSLGCNYKKEAVFTKEYLENHRVRCNLINFSFLGKTHKVHDYFNKLYSPLIWGY